MLIDAVKAALWGMALLVHCLLLLLLVTSAEWIELPWWTWLPWRDEFFLKEYDSGIIRHIDVPELTVTGPGAEQAQQLMKGQRTFELTEDNRDGHLTGLLDKRVYVISAPTGQDAARLLEEWLKSSGQLVPASQRSSTASPSRRHIIERLELLASRDEITSYRRWLAIWEVCKVSVRIIAVFLLLVLVRALWLGATPYLSLIILLAPIAVLLNMPYYVIMHHEFSKRVNVWESFPYWALGAIVVIFIAWPPLLVILRKRQQSLWRMALAVCLPGSRAALRNKRDT